MAITTETLNEATGLGVEGSLSFDHLGPLDSARPNTLSFLDTEEFLGELLRNENVRGVLITPELASRASESSAVLIECDDPRFHYFTLFNDVARKAYRTTPSVVHPSARIHPTAYVHDSNVQIGEDTVIEANATILADVVMGARCRVGAGSVLGCDDAEVKRTSRGLLRVFHDGRLVLGDGVEVGANCTIDKGFSVQDTVIGDDTRLGNTTLVGHSVKIGRRCMLLCCSLLGSVVLEDHVRVNPGAIVSSGVRLGEGAVVSLGAVVIQDVPPQGRVTGNFAVEHLRFMYGHARAYGPF